MKRTRILTTFPGSLLKLGLIAGLISGSLAISTLQAAEVPEAVLWKLCEDKPADYKAPAYDFKLEFGSTEVDAHEMEVSEDGVTTLTGDVEVHHNDNTIYADQAIYDDQQSSVDINGNISLWTEGIFWEGQHANVDRVENISRLDQGNYRLLNRRGHGKANKVVDIPNRDITRLKNVEYTTCPGSADDNFPWRLDAKKLRLNHDENWGQSIHNILRIKNIPVLYIPFLQFPLTDDRMSGLLPMTLGATDDSGLDIRTPYYWNIAPDQDATITPRILSDRGLMLGTQYRYLRPTGKGIFELEYLSSDDLKQNKNRYLFDANLYESFAGGRGGFTLDFNQVSDQQYFEDLSSSIDVTSQRLLDRRADLTYSGSWWTSLARLQSYQTVDSTLLNNQRPYDRLPQLYFSTLFPQRNKNLNFIFSSEAVYFSREDSINGGRLDLTPELNFPVRGAAGFFVPRVKLRHTSYSLDRNDGIDSTPDRSLPILSADGGLFFEKDLKLGKSTYLHTLEPRIFYLFIPNSGQDDIPVFDTGAFDFTFSQLFRDDRFNAADRVGDANQLTLALTTRFIDRNTGWERLRLSVGQIQYFRDREVNLPGIPVDTENSSDIVAEVASQVAKHWRARYDVQWDPHSNRTERSSVNLRYQPDRQTIFNVAYRMRKELINIEQAEFSMRLPINPNWSVVSGWNYSLQNDRTIEALFGFEYNSCCWATRVIGRRFLRNAQGDFDNAVFFQLELKGLGGFGRSARDFLQQNIPGYQYEF